MAPEIVTQKPYGRAVDWWALGVIGFRMLFGISPFSDQSDSLIFNNIIHKDYEIPESTTVSATAQDFIRGLLIKDPKQRLGGSSSDYVDLQQHPWFDDFEWDDLIERKIPMAIKPVIDNSDLDDLNENFDELFKNDPLATEDKG